MADSFESIRLLHIGGRANQTDKQTATLAVRLESEEHDGHFPLVEIALLLDKRPEATLRELEEQARAAALSTLREVTNFSKKIR